MGFWSTSLYGNDLCCDVKEAYIDWLHKYEDENEVNSMLMNEFSECLGTDEEPLFWYSFADMQWRYGRLSDDVKNRALYWIDNLGGAELFQPKQQRKWLLMIGKLKEKLLSPMPEKKEIVIPPKFETNPWKIGDLYAYQFYRKYSKECGMAGKYIVMQKISDEEYCDGEIISRVQVFDKIYDEIPQMDDVLKQRILPFDSPDRFIAQDENSKIFPLTLDECLIISEAKKYPRKHLYFIGNSTDNHFTPFEPGWYDSMFWQSLEQLLCIYVNEWKNYDYSVTADGTFITEK